MNKLIALLGALLIISSSNLIASNNNEKSNVAIDAWDDLSKNSTRREMANFISSLWWGDNRPTNDIKHGIRTSVLKNQDFNDPCRLFRNMSNTDWKNQPGETAKFFHKETIKMMEALKGSDFYVDETYNAVMAGMVFATAFDRPIACSCGFDIKRKSINQYCKAVKKKHDL